MSCSSETGAESSSEVPEQDSITHETIVIAAIENLVPPFEVSVKIDSAAPDNNSILQLDQDIRDSLELTDQWWHPTGFQFSDGLLNVLYGKLDDPDFNIFITYHEGYEHTMAGHFSANFFLLSVFDANHQLQDQRIIAGTESLKDGGMGHYKEMKCHFQEGLSFRVNSINEVYDFEDEEAYEDTLEYTEYYQIQTDGLITMIPN